MRGLARLTALDRSPDHSIIGFGWNEALMTSAHSLTGRLSMSFSNMRSLGMILAAAALIACGGDSARESSAADSENAQRAVATPAPGTETREGAVENATRVLGAAEADCPLRGEWRICSVEDRLVRAGLAPQRADSAPVLTAGSVSSARYFVGDAEAQVFIFTDSVSRASAEANQGAGLGEAPLLESAVGAQPVIVSSRNMAVIIHGFRPRQVERVSLALSGGLPQG